MFGVCLLEDGLSYPGQESRPLRASGRREQQPAVQIAERYSLPFPDSAAAAAERATCFGGSQQQLPPGFFIIRMDFLYPWSVTLGLQFDSPLDVLPVAAALTLRCSVSCA